MFLTRVRMLPILLSQSAVTHCACISDLCFKVSVQVIGSAIKTGSLGRSKRRAGPQKKEKLEGQFAVSH